MKTSNSPLDLVYGLLEDPVFFPPSGSHFESPGKVSILSRDDAGMEYRVVIEGSLQKEDFLPYHRDELIEIEQTCLIEVHLSKNYFAPLNATALYFVPSSSKMTPSSGIPSSPTPVLSVSLSETDSQISRSLGTSQSTSMTLTAFTAGPTFQIPTVSVQASVSLISQKSPVRPKFNFLWVSLDPPEGEV